MSSPTRAARTVELEAREILRLQLVLESSAHPLDRDIYAKLAAALSPRRRQSRGYESVCFVGSKTDPTKQYEVKRNVVTGVVSCGCSAWRFHKGAPEERTCKHLDSLGVIGVLKRRPAPTAIVRRIASDEQVRSALGTERRILLDD